MGQLSWTYLDDCGSHYDVGLYHGENSGHLMLYVNASPVIIDFSVSDSKNYSLFIGEELCNLVLEKKDGSFAYGLIPDTNADTDLNRLRRKLNISNNIKTVFMAFLVLMVIVGMNLYLGSGI